MSKTTAGSQLLDDFLNGGYENGVVTTIYGPGSCGKTLLLMLAMCKVSDNKKIIFIDTEGGFSVERLSQVCPDHKKVMERTVFLKPTNFEEQNKAISELKSLLKTDIGLVLVDTLTSLYRVEMTSEDNYDVNKELAKQLRDLVEIARKKDIPVLVTGLVYASMGKENEVRLVGGNIAKNMSKCLLEIQKEDTNRKLIVRKHRAMPEGRGISFNIVEKGLS